MSRRVMNLAHLADPECPPARNRRVGFIWGDRSWTWREIDGLVSALAAALAARGIVKGDRILVHSKNCDEMFWSMFSAFRLGAVWVPTNFRLMPDEVVLSRDGLRRQGVSLSRRFSRPCRRGGASSRALAFTWRIGEGAFGEKSLSEAIAGACGLGDRGGQSRL